SNVSTSSFGPSGNVPGKCLRPTRGVSAALTASTRSVPSVSGRGQLAASAAVVARISAAVVLASRRIIGGRRLFQGGVRRAIRLLEALTGRKFVGRLS